MLLHGGPEATHDYLESLEGMAETAQDAETALARGDVQLEPCHHRDAVGPMAGVISPSMWVYELRDEVHDHTSWCSLNEGLGKVLRLLRAARIPVAINVDGIERRRQHLDAAAGTQALFDRLRRAALLGDGHLRHR